MKRSHFTNWINKRMGFFALLVICVWAKSLLAYFTEFHLALDNPLQYFILFINPFATTIFMLGIALYARKPRTSYILMLIISGLLTLLLFSNIIYFREFSDFITINTMLSSGKVSAGLGESALKLFRFYDPIYWIDLVILPILLLTKKIKLDSAPIRARYALAVSCLSVLLFSVNLSLAETSRPELLSRTFSRDYIVKYLGVNVFTVYDGVKTYQANKVRASASENDLGEVEEYVKEHYAAPNNAMFGKAKGKNVIYVHLESFQQFLINYKLKDENGVEHEVTPFLNSLVNGNETYSFDNLFHQVKDGKTSDAETLLENSFFGISQGPLFTQFGGENTFQAAPDILNQVGGYSSAVFHGNTATFWNRNEVYKRFGYQYFFSKDSYETNAENTLQYGLKDKPFFQQSVQYLEHMQQPFYTKFITVTNHYPYSELTGDDAGFPLAKTGDSTINGYFATANYLDQSIKEFVDYLKKAGLYDNTMLVFYGDHYGISNSRNPDLAELLGKDKETWNDFDNNTVQRVPLIIHIPGVTDGKIYHTYGGQVDILPTVLHLLGVETDKYLQLGTDLFSKDHDDVVAFRNGNFVTPTYTSLGSNVYNSETGELYEDLTAEQQKTIEELQAKVDRQLAVSDALTNKDLLRYYDGSGLKPVDSEAISYKDQLAQLEAIEEKLGDQSTSLYSKNDNQSTVNLYTSGSFKEDAANQAKKQK